MKKETWEIIKEMKRYAYGGDIKAAIELGKKHPKNQRIQQYVAELKLGLVDKNIGAVNAETLEKIKKDPYSPFVAQVRAEIDDPLASAVFETALHEMRGTKVTDKGRKEVKSRLMEMLAEENEKDGDKVDSEKINIIKTLKQRLGTASPVLDMGLYLKILEKGRMGLPKIKDKGIDGPEL